MRKGIYHLQRAPDFLQAKDEKEMEKDGWGNAVAEECMKRG